MQCDIKPYWDLADGEIEAVYGHARREKLLRHIPRETASSPEMFQLFARRAECFCVVYSAGEKHLGFLYLSHFEGATARLHLALAEGENRGAASPALTACRQVLDWCFSTFEFQSLLTVVPATDQTGTRLWTALASTPPAEIPGLCWLEFSKKTAPGQLFILRRDGGALA